MLAARSHFFRMRTHLLRIRCARVIANVAGRLRLYEHHSPNGMGSTPSTGSPVYTSYKIIEGASRVTRVKSI